MVLPTAASSHAMNSPEEQTMPRSSTDFHVQEDVGEVNHEPLTVKWLKLLDQKGMVDFENYAHSLDLLVISRNFYEGHGTDNIKEAETAWENSSKTLNQLANEYAKELSALSSEAQQSALSIQMIAKHLNSYVKWLCKMVDTTQKVYKKLECVKLSFELSKNFIVSPAQVEKIVISCGF